MTKKGAREERDKLNKRICENENCRISIPLSTPVFVNYVVTKPGEDHLGTKHARFWCQTCLTPAELNRIINERSGR